MSRCEENTPEKICTQHVHRITEHKLRFAPTVAAAHLFARTHTRAVRTPTRVHTNTTTAAACDIARARSDSTDSIIVNHELFTSKMLRTQRTENNNNSKKPTQNSTDTRMQQLARSEILEQHQRQRSKRSNAKLPVERYERTVKEVRSVILLYGAPVWSTAAQKRAYIRQAESAHRRACLRVIGGRPHVAYEATYVLAGIPPLALLADERARLYGRRREDAKDEERLATLSKWQEAWDRSTKARWTNRLIPNIRVWIERRHGELNYHLTQLLTGHGFFKHHSRRYDHNQSAQCPVCPSSIENAEHVFYHCPRFSEERERLHSLLYEVVTPENTTRLMLASEPNWLALSLITSFLRRRCCEHRALKTTTTPKSRRKIRRTLASRMQQLARSEILEQHQRQRSKRSNAKLSKERNERAVGARNRTTRAEKETERERERESGRRTQTFVVRREAASRFSGRRNGRSDSGLGE
ncbi:unnamed protein product [Trichogramma brassicae]|uniref:Reverse transcriptase zinc-binding domain-containing protein n=1 Tax=Trichogramma brassicae TaxID=86971 RepID=A0A6H5J6Z9_9HYME|nr:unnamed protein product [Trichogramma brassicae]